MRRVLISTIALALLASAAIEFTWPSGSTDLLIRAMYALGGATAIWAIAAAPAALLGRWGDREDYHNKFAIWFVLIAAVMIWAVANSKHFDHCAANLAPGASIGECL